MFGKRKDPVVPETNKPAPPVSPPPAQPVEPEPSPVWKFEAHSPINLTPFKSSIYEVDFDDIEYTATIMAKQPFGPGCATGYTNFVIKMSAIEGVQTYTAYLTAGVWIVKIGENRYLIGRKDERMSITKRILAILSEMVTATEAVALKHPDDETQWLDMNDYHLKTVRQILEDFRTSGLADILPEDNGNVTVITQYNS